MLERIVSSMSLKSTQPQAALSFKEGQVFRGSVQQLFPNQLAAISIKGFPVIAQLEAPLMAHANYWFQVVSTSEKLKLKIISPTQDGKAGKQVEGMEQLLQSMGLPVSKQTKELADFLIQKQLPFTKEVFVKAMGWLTTASHSKTSYQALEQLLRLNLPLTDSVFKSLQHVHDETNLSTSLERISKLVNAYEEQPVVKQVKPILDSIMNQRSHGRMQHMVQSVIEQIVSGTVQNESTEVYEQVLSKLSIPIDKQAVQEQFQSLVVSGAYKDHKEVLSAIVKFIYTDTLRQQVVTNTPTIEQFMSRFTEQEQQMLESLVTTHKDISATQIKTVLQVLGLQHEWLLSQQLPHQSDSMTSAGTLKAALLSLMEQIPDTKVAVEPIVHKLTGLQLINREEAPIQQLILQFPLQLPNDKTYDVTMQWHGKKRENGTIDPNHCRIMFYLQLGHMGETICDVHIQNTIVSITVWNDTNGLEMLIPMFQKQLEEHLSAMSYTLSQIKVEKSKQTQTRLPFESSKKTSGIDIRL